MFFGVAPPSPQKQEKCRQVAGFRLAVGQLQARQAQLQMDLELLEAELAQQTSSSQNASTPNRGISGLGQNVLELIQTTEANLAEAICAEDGFRARIAKLEAEIEKMD